MQCAGTTTVFIVDDSPEVRDALIDLLQELDNVEIAGSAEDAPTAIGAISRCRPDYAVLDYQLRGRSTAVDILRALRPALPGTGFIVLTNHATTQHRRACLAAGAHWFLDKTNEFAQVRDIIAQPRTPHAPGEQS